MDEHDEDDEWETGGARPSGWTRAIAVTIVVAFVAPLVYAAVANAWSALR
jgi:hypothetical protein